VFCKSARKISQKIAAATEISDVRKKMQKKIDQQHCRSLFVLLQVHSE